MTSIPVYDYAGLPPAERADLESAMQPLRTLADVLVWARAHTPPWSVARVLGYAACIIVPEQRMHLSLTTRDDG